MTLIEDIDYIDADVAYLLGLITARGRISENSDVRRIVNKNATANYRSGMGHNRLSPKQTYDDWGHRLIKFTVW